MTPLRPSLDEFRLEAERGDLIPVVTEIVSDVETPVGAFAKLGRSGFSFLFESAERNEESGRFSFIGIDPLAVISLRGSELTIREKSGTLTKRTVSDPLDELRNTLAGFRFLLRDDIPHFQGGAVGFVGYDVVRFFEPKATIHPQDELALPEMLFMIAGTLIVFDHRFRTIRLVVLADVRKQKADAAYKEAAKEIEGTLALLNGRPEFARRIKAAIHMDMVGGGPATKAVFHVTHGPRSLPSFVHDVAWAFAEFVNEESYKFAATGSAEYPLVAPEGGKEPLQAQFGDYTMGSDHDVYQDSSFGIPAIYLNDWPDRYIHTNFDSAANIDTTKLKRAAFIGAASGYFLARLTSADMPKDRVPALIGSLSAHRPARFGQLLHRCESLSAFDCGEMTRPFVSQEMAKVDSIQSFATVPPDWRQMEWTHTAALETHLLSGRAVRTEILLGDYGRLWQRKAQPKGPLAVFGYDYFVEHAKTAGVATPKLLSYEGLWGGGEEYAYEVLNFANGKRNTQEIRDAVSAEYGPVPVEMVLEYLQALEKIGVVERMK